MKKALLTALAAVQVLTVFAQSTDSIPKGLRISGNADVYYRYNFNENYTDNKTSFTNSHNSFELGMISLKLEHNTDKVGVVADIGFGKRAADFSYTDIGSEGTSSASAIAIKQLFISYAVTPNLKFTVGSYGTHVGYELVDACLNRNYSMSYMFTNGPFSHTGIKADVSLGEHSFMLGVFNPTDFKSAIFKDGNLTSKKYIGAQYGYSSANAPLKAYLNYIGGVDTVGTRNDQVDLVITYQFTPKFGIGYNGTYSMFNFKTANGNGKPVSDKRNWYGSALYLNYDPVEKFGLTLRTEYFGDKDNIKVFTDPLAFPKGGNVLAFTLSGNYRIGGLTIVPEVRLDQASESVFSKKDVPKKNTVSALLAVLYKF